MDETKPDTAELRYWIGEALKRNDRTYAALAQMEKNLPGGEDGPLSDLWRETEEAQQTTRRKLIEMHERVKRMVVGR